MSDDRRLELRVDISIADYQGGGGQLRISEQVMIPVAGFLELAAVLGEFHKVVEKLKEDQ